MSCRVLLAAYKGTERALLEYMLAESDRFQLVRTLAAPDGLAAHCRSLHIDLVLTDVMFASEPLGLWEARVLRREAPSVRLILMAELPEVSWPERAQKSGADALCYLEPEPDAVLSVMERVMNGERVFPDEAPPVRLGNAESSELTVRETEVLRALLTGQSNTQIAQRLSISDETVKFHIRSMLQKTGFRTRTELAVQARVLGIVV